MTEQLPEDRAEQAARDWFAEQAAGTAAGSINPAAIRAAAERRQRARFTGLLAAAAAVLAVLVIVPLALRPAGAPITGVPAPSGRQATWTTTAPAPLSPRFGSLTAWLDGQFYLMGGWEGGGGPCQPLSVCDMKIPELRDGARYDPATDSWTPIAELPQGVGRDYASTAATAGVLYLVSAGDRAAWRYTPDSDRWERISDLPADGGLVATDSTLFLNTYDGRPAHYVYQPDADSWAPLPDGPVDSCQSWRTLAAGERLLVIGRCGEDGAELRTTFYDPVAAEWAEASPIPGITAESTSFYAGSDPVYAAGRLLWPDALSAVSSMHTPGIYDLERRTWQDVSTGVPGGLSYRFADVRTPHPVLAGLGLVEANGNLLDVRTRDWLEVPDSPAPDGWDPVLANGPESLLRCYGYRYSDDSYQDGSYAEGCYLLTVTKAPVTPESGSPAPSGWQEVPPPDPQPRQDPLAVYAAGSYYLMGGWRSDANWNDEQLRTGYRFDPATGAWQPIAELPEVGLSSPYTMNADVVGETIYVQFSFEEQGELWAYDTAADSWRKLENTGEGDYFVSTADGLVKVLSDEGAPRLLLLVDGQWLDLPKPPPGSAVFRLGEHQVGYLPYAGGVAVLDTTTRSWLPTSAPGATENRYPYGVDGAAVLVYPPDNEGELIANNKHGLLVDVWLDGSWSASEPMLTDGGLGAQIGAVAGRWIVIAGNLFDPHTGEWSSVPAIPGSDYQWVSPTVAGGPPGLLSCFPLRDIDSSEPRAVASCYFYPVPEQAVTPPPQDSEQPSPDSEQPPQWRTVTPPDPEPRRFPLLVKAAGSYYLMGGRQGAANAEQPVRTAFRLDQGTWSWQPTAELPKSLADHELEAAVVGATIYVWFNTGELAELWAYDTTGDSWRRIERASADRAYVATEDGVVRFTWGDQEYHTVPPELLVDGAWVKLPMPPTGAGGWWRWLASLGDQRIAMVGDGRVTTLDTASRTWSEPSEPAPGDLVSRTMSSGFGVDGTMVVVGSEPRQEGYLVYADGAWTAHQLPSAAAGGFNGTGLTLGHRVVVADWLFDPVTGAGQQLPPLPGEGQLRHFQSAGDDSGILTCYPLGQDLQPEASCAYLDLTG